MISFENEDSEEIRKAMEKVKDAKSLAQFARTAGCHISRLTLRFGLVAGNNTRAPCFRVRMIYIDLENEALKLTHELVTPSLRRTIVVEFC
jgi:hypothetical protein